MELNEYIKKLRVEKGITQRELAKMIGLSVSMLQQYEYGHYQFKNEILLKIIDAFNMNLEDFRNYLTNEAFSKINKTQIVSNTLDEVKVNLKKQNKINLTEFVWEFLNEKNEEKIEKIKKILTIINRFEFSIDKNNLILNIRDTKNNKEYDYFTGLDSIDEIYSQLFDEIEVSILLFFERLEFQALNLFNESSKNIPPTDK